MSTEKKNPYAEIMGTQWPRTSLRVRMSHRNRAKIFLPFAALKGYEESLEVTREESQKNM